MTGDAYRANQTVLCGLKRSFQHAARAEGNVRLDGIGQIVELPQVYVVNAHTFEGMMKLLLRLAGCAHICLGGHEELVPVARQPGRDAYFCVAITGRHVDMVTATL